MYDDNFTTGESLCYTTCQADLDCLHFEYEENVIDGDIIDATCGLYEVTAFEAFTADNNGSPQRLFSDRECESGLSE